MRKAIRKPHFSAYLDSLRGDQPLELVLTGHLVIEALLVEIIQLQANTGDAPWRWNFPDKVKATVNRGLLTSDHAQMYLRLNDVRNDFGHILGHRLSYEDLFKWAKEMNALGYDFSDDTIHRDAVLSEERYGFPGIITEIINELYMELAWILHDHGGEDRLG